MRTVRAVFDTYDEVSAAVDGLADMGVTGSDVAIINQHRHATRRIVEGAGPGAAIGGLVGAIVSLRSEMMPAFGALASVAWVLPAFLFAAAGGFAGSVIAFLTNSPSKAPTRENEALVFPACVRAGGTLLVAKVQDDEVGEAAAILRRCGAIDTNARRGEYAAGGWDGFVANDIWDDDIGNEDRPSRSDETIQRRVA